MSAVRVIDDPSVRRGATRPPRAVVGSQVDTEETIFASLDGRILRRFWLFVAPYRRRLVWALAAVLAFTASQIAIPLVLRLVVDNALVAGAAIDDVSIPAERLLLVGIAAFFAVASLNFVANLVQETLVSRIAERLLIDMRRAMFAHLQRVSLAFMDKTETGRLMSRLQGDVHALQEFLETSVFAIGDFVLLVGIAVVLLVLDWRLGLLTLSVMPILVAVRIVWLPRARKAFLRARVTSSTLNGALAEGIHGVRTVQGMGREDVNLALFEEKAADNLDAQLQGTWLAQIMVPIVDGLTGAAMGIVVVAGGTAVLGGRIELGVMVAFLFYVQRFFDPIRSLTMQYSVMQRAMASGQRIFEVLDVPISVQDRADALDPAEIDGSVAFEDVTFGYLAGQPVLQNVSFRAEPGQTVALVGPTGSGKSSTMALAHRFYDVWDGRVLVGGLDVRDLTQASLGRHIAMVLQDPFLFTGTIAENIRYARTDASDAQVIDAARAVGADAFIRALPDGYATLLEQQGGNLSQGQRQLISFARALVADARILILDEATASIDSYTERSIQRALARLLEGRTALVIAHRLATIRHADRIVVLQQGRIIEDGSHAQLMRRGGLYARLYRMNYASFDDIDV
ncbi:MAG: ABC transporter ATP-binding protein [Geminicoccaceae bacterium]|nr:ABC transporter ATP-binding protein [Geminicoccaceae bacterium]